VVYHILPESFCLHLMLNIIVAVDTVLLEFISKRPQNRIRLKKSTRLINHIT